MTSSTSRQSMAEHATAKDERIVSLDSGRGTIYGNYVAPAVARCGGGAWHIQSIEADDRTLCGKHLAGDLSRMSLHVSSLVCSRCMALGGERASAPQGQHQHRLLQVPG